MASQWIPQNIQKRLLRYALEQLSLFSEIDLQKLDVSFGTSTNVTLKDVEIDTDKFNLPGVYMRSGRIDKLNMTLAMSDGVNIVCDGIHVSLTPAPSKKHTFKQGEFSLAKSTAELARSAAYEDYVDDDMSDKQFVSTLEASIMKSKTLDATDDEYRDYEDEQPPKLSGVMQRAAEYALSKLHIQLKNIVFIILTDSSKIQLSISSIVISSSGDVQNIQIGGVSVNIPSDHPEQTDSCSSTTQNPKSCSNTNETSDSDSDTDEYNDVLMSTSFMSNSKNDIHQSLIQSVLRSHNPASTVYMSAETEFSEAKSRLPLADRAETDQNDKEVPDELMQIAYIDKLSASFSGLQDIRNLNISVGSIRLATSPLPNVINSLLAALIPTKDIIKINRNEKNSGNEERRFANIIQSIKILELEVALRSTLKGNGNFSSLDGPIMRFEEFQLEKKSENYYFGHIKSVGITRNTEETSILHFLKTKDEQHEVEMEIEISDEFQMAFTLPYQGYVKLKEEDLLSLISYYYKCELFINRLRNLSLKKSSSKSPSEITVRTSRISLEYVMSLDTYLNLDLSPIKYDSKTGLAIKQAKFTFQAHAKELPGYLVFNEVNYNLLEKTKRVKGYGANGNKITTFDTNSELHVRSIKSNIFMEDIPLLVEHFDEIRYRMESLRTMSTNPSAGQRSVHRNRSVRIANSLFLDRKLCAETYYKVETVELLIRHVNDEFGDLHFSGANFCAASFKGRNSELYFENICIKREKQELVQQFVSASAISHTDKKPLLFASIGSSITVYIRSCRLDYYGIWLTILENAGGGEVVEEQAARALIGETKQQKEVQKRALKIEIILTNTLIGLTPIHMPSHSILFIKKSNASIHINNNGMIYGQMSMNTTSIFLIDDKDCVMKKPGQVSDWTATSYLRKLGYVYIGTCNSLFLHLKIGSVKSILSLTYKSADLKRYHSLVDVKLDMDLLHLYACADSFSCFIQLCNDLKEPLFFTFDEKYKTTQSEEIDTYSDVDNNFFSYKEKQSLKNRESNGDNDSGLPSESQPQQTDKESSNSEPLSIIEDFYKGEYGSKSLIDSENSQRESLKSSKDVASELSVQSDHFGRIDAKVGKPKIIPMSITLGLRKIELLMYDGYEWKETRNQIAEAIRRVQKTADIAKKIHNEKKKAGKSKVLESDMITDSPKLNNPESGIPSKIVEETLFQSIHLGVHPGESLGSAYDRVNESINPQGWTDDSLLNTSSNASKKPTIDINVEKSSKSYKDLQLKRSRTFKAKIVIDDVDLLFLLVSDNEPRPKSKPSIFCNDNVSSEVDTHICVSELVGRLQICIGDMKILDNVPSSSWNMFLGYMREAGKRELGSTIIKLGMDIVRPIPELAASELRMSVSVLPLRMYVDQDTLEFLVRFTEFHDSRFSWLAKDNDELFLESVRINPIKLKLNYKPKKVDFAGLRSGHTDEFMNFFMLEDSNMVLRQLNVHGVSGFGRLQQLLRSYWMPDIKKNQLGGVLAGVTPIKSLVKIGSGFRNLAVVPVKEYRKDGRVLRSLEKGATSFGRTAGGELLRLGVKLANGTQTILENVELMLGGEGSAGRISSNTESVMGKGKEKSYTALSDDDDLDHYEQYFIHPKAQERARNADGLDSTIGEDELFGEKGHDDHDGEIETIDSETDSEDDDKGVDSQRKEKHGKTVSLYANPPQDLHAGMKKAYTSFGHNITVAQRAFTGASSRASESTSAGEAALEYAKATPVMLIRPLIGTTEAISKTLLGGLSELDPDERKRSVEKYKQN
ncbi:ATG2 [Brettanomyces bruxellensis]|uniref:Autophagy-related protein 2 n=1 Tax=Dekkera bruxellensis TaxID=5007 RepID=A0A7D9H763_DEKBR|nr:ATG2 [Brettanomyces bruxellensis]